jgi:hypothetical protein
MLEFNVGELATRLRSALTVRGRMPLGLDEVVIPTALTADVSGPPWRRNPVRGVAAWSSETAVVGSYASIELHLGTLGPVPEGNTLFVLESIVLAGPSFVTATGLLLPNAGAFAHFLPVRTSALTFQPFITGERYPPSGTIDQNQLPGGLRNGTALTDPALDAGRIAQVEAAGSIAMPLECVVLGTEAIRFTAKNPGSAANTSRVVVSVSGLFYTL